jgi:phenylacetate-CoA ligase
VPYYRQLFARLGFDPEGAVGVESLRSLPFLDKPTIRANTDALKSEHAGKLIRYNTGGSSGEPLVFYMGMDRVSHDVAAKWRATRWWDVDIGDVEVVLWGSPIEIGKQDRIKAVRDRVFRTHLLPAFQMTPAQMDGYLDRIRELRPKMLFGYASALALLATHAENRGRDMHGLGTKVAFTTGETLYPAQRDVIERVFGAPVANGYGSRDAGFIAHQCPQGSLHLSAEHIIVELVDAAGRPVAPGEQGEVVVTHLATASFPFVRYRTGDMAVAGTKPCTCGRGLPVLERVFGRSTDFVRTRDGNTLHALALIYEVRDKPGVQAFKFIQSEDLALELLVVAGPELTANVEAEIRRGLLARMGADSELTVRRVAEIPPEKSGKYRYVVSRAIPSASAAQTAAEH